MSIISKSSLAIVNATKGVVAENALKITTNFYPRMFKNNPEVFKYFNKSNQRANAQPTALADAIVAYAINIEKLENLTEDVERIAQKHCALNIQAEDYQIVHDNLMASIAEVLGDAVTPEIGAAWSEAVMGLAKIFIVKEAGLYKEALDSVGGWNGKREFTVRKVVRESEDTVSLTLASADGKEIMNHIPGQYISVVTNPSNDQYFSPRHYTLTNHPGASTYRITPKYLEAEDGDHSHDGVESTYLNHLKVGDSINLFPPFGPATFNTEGDVKKPAAIISVGVGITPTIPMVPVALSLRPEVFIFHGNKDSQHVALKKEIEAMKSVSGDKLHLNYYYLEPLIEDKFGEYVREGLVTADTIEAELQQNNRKIEEVEYYICARPVIGEKIAKGLVKKGVSPDNIFREEFGPHHTMSFD